MANEQKQAALRASIEDYCVYLGKNPLIVQGAGGNISWKDGETLWVKASGKRLVDAKAANIFVPVDLYALRIAIQKKDFNATPLVLGGASMRPSIETNLHALMPHKIVMHLHSVEILAALVKEGCQEEVNSRMSDSVGWRFVEYFKPGPDLARAIFNAGVDFKTQVIFLRNHGVIVGADSIEEVDQILRILLNIFHTLPTELNVSLVSEEFKLPDCFNGYVLIQDACIQQLALNSNFIKNLSDNWAICPDHVVFLGPSPIIYSKNDVLSGVINSQQVRPALIFIEGIGVYSLPEFSKAQFEQLRFYWDVVVRTDITSKVSTLNEDEVCELINWDAEKYRIHVSR